MASTTSRLRSTLAAALLFGCASCTGDATSEPGAKIVTTIAPLQMIVSEITGREVTVAALLPSGASPHTFEPLAADLARIKDAEFFVRIGGGLDDWAARLLAAAENRPSELVVVEIEGLRLIHRDGDCNHDHAGGAHGHSDPHVWLDPVRVRDHIVPAIADRLAALDPERAKEYRLRAARFRTLVSETDAALRRTLEPVEGGSFLAFHDTWRYFADRYGIVQQSAVHGFAGEEPTPHEIAEIVRSLSGSETRTVIVEPQFSPRLAETISREIGASIAEADPMGGAGIPGRDTYDGLMRFNAERFAEALGGR